MRIALLIDGEARIALGAKSVRQVCWMLSALDYGNVRNVSQLGKNRDGLQPRVKDEGVGSCWFLGTV